MFAPDFFEHVRIGIRHRLLGGSIHFVNPLGALRLFLGRWRSFPAFFSAAFQFLFENFFVVRVRSFALHACVDTVREQVAVRLHFFRLGFALRPALVPRFVLELRTAVFAHHRLTEPLHKSAQGLGIFPPLRLLFFRRHIPRDVRRHREQVARGFDHHASVRRAEPPEIQAVAPVPGKRFSLPVELAKLLHGDFRHLHFARRRAVADHAALPLRETRRLLSRERRLHRHGVHKFQSSPREVAPRVALQRELDRLREPGEPDEARHAVARAVVDFTSDHTLVDAPRHGAAT